MAEDPSTPTSDCVPPSPARRPVERTHHGDVVVDPYAWLRDSDDPEVVALLEAENRHADCVTAHLGPLTDAVFGEIKARTKETDLSVPVAYRGWWYYSRTEEGKQYARLCRVPQVGESRPVVDATTAPPEEQVLVDGEIEAAGGEFFALGAAEVDNRGERVAFAVDRSGDERFDVVVREIEGGRVVDTALREVGYGLVWSACDAYLFYTRVDEAWRPHEVWRHEVGTPAEHDVRIFHEEDETHWMGIDASRDERWLVLTTSSRSSSEVQLLDLADPTGPLRCVRPRTPDLEYDVEPAGDELFVVHNADRVDFSVATVALADLLAADEESCAPWREWWTPAAGERVVAVEAFERFVALSLRSGGLPVVRIVPRAVGGGGDAERRGGVERPDPAGIVTIPACAELGVTATGENPEWGARRLQIVQESYLTPRRVCEYDPETGNSVVLKQREVLGGYDPSRYVESRIWVTAEDSTQIPMSVVRRTDVPLDGTAPGLLRGYGAYEMPSDPYFSVPSLSILDRGVVLAVAHVRGGGEMGRSWWLQGRFTDKVNSFTDLVACGRHLVDSGAVAADRLALEGGSAGGLLVGAAVNLAPDLFRVVHAAVPFVDALTTILDPSLPLTVTEWEEWGNPLADPEIYRVMKAYSPYENVRATEYPAILATSSLNDTRVPVGEPLKWVTRLRETVTSDPVTHPIVMRTEMVAGHGGRSGRYDAWRQVAAEFAFLLDRIGAVEVLDGPA